MANGPMITETEAMKKLCPLSYSQPGGALNCIGSGCMLWVEAREDLQDAREAYYRLHPGSTLPPFPRVGCCGLTGVAR